MSRLVFCARCDTDLGVLFEREADDGSTSVDFLPHGDCWHLRREQVVDDLEALFSGESSLPVKLRREAHRISQPPLRPHRARDRSHSL